MAQATRLGPGGYPIAAKPASGATNHAQTVAAPVVSSAAHLTKAVAKHSAAAAAAAVSFVKSAGHKVLAAAAAIVAASGAKNATSINHAQTIAVVASSTVNIVKGLGKAIAAAVAAAIAAAGQKVIAGGTNHAVTIVALCNSIIQLVFPSGAEPVIGDVSVVWSVSASVGTEWSTAAQVTATMSQELQL